MDRKAQMMDAGTALFSSGEEFGPTIGRVMAEMAVYGKVFKPSEIDPEILPFSTGRCDLFLDWSTPWRYRYISALVEDVPGEGERRYAVTFKEGNRSTPLRAGVHILLILCFLSLFFWGNAWLGICGVAAACLTAYRWVAPSRKAVRVVRALIAKLSTK